MRRKNIEAIVQILILLMTAFLLLSAMISNKINYYVHPRFYKGIWISIVVLVIFAIGLKSKVKNVRHHVNIKHYVIFMIPLVMAFLFPANGELSTKDMSVSVSDVTTLSSSSTDTVNTMNTDENNISNAANETVDTEENETITNAAEKYTQYEENGVMMIDDNVFADWYTDLYADLDSFVGKKVEYLAQVYSEDDFDDNKFLAGRYFMVCCAADMVGCGIICESDERSTLVDDEWITVEGTIETYEYNGETLPILKDTTITKTEAPKVEYIYYNMY